MASPQKENGYTPIANELLEQIYSGTFNATQFKLIFLIFRYTYGFNRKSHEFSLAFIKDALGGDKRNIQRELQRLIDGNIIQIVSEATFKSPRQLAINKNYESWDKSFLSPFPPTGGESPTTTGGESPTTTGGESPTTTGGESPTQERKNKTNIKKESIKENTHSPPKQKKYGEYGWCLLTDDEYLRLCDDYGEDMVKHYLRYVDESAQQSENRNEWKDWNLVIRKAIRNKWGGEYIKPQEKMKWIN